MCLFWIAWGYPDVLEKSLSSLPQVTFFDNKSDHFVFPLLGGSYFYTLKGGMLIKDVRFSARNCLMSVTSGSSFREDRS